MVAFLNKTIFKAYDIRGKFPEEINPDVVLEISKSLSKFFKLGKVVIAHDDRLSSPLLYTSVLKGIKNNKELHIIDVGLATTPMLYFLVNYFNASGGIMVTASHDPKKMNGLKVVKEKAEPISGKEVLQIMNYGK